MKNENTVKNSALHFGKLSASLCGKKSEIRNRKSEMNNTSDIRHRSSDKSSDIGHPTSNNQITD